MTKQLIVTKQSLSNQSKWVSFQSHWAAVRTHTGDCSSLQYGPIFGRVSKNRSCVRVRAHTAMQESPILAAAPLVCSQWGVWGWRRSFKQMWCSLLFLFLIISCNSDIEAITSRIRDAADGERCATEAAWRGEAGDREEKGDRRDCGLTVLLPGAWDNQRKMTTIPIIRILFWLWPWGKVTDIFKKHLIQNEMTHPWISNMLRATLSHDNCFLNRWVNENRCHSAEEENPPFRLSRCHINPLGGRERERTACRESKNKTAAGSSGG